MVDVCMTFFKGDGKPSLYKTEVPESYQGLFVPRAILLGSFSPRDDGTFIKIAMGNIIVHNPNGKPTFRAYFKKWTNAREDEDYVPWHKKPEEEARHYMRLCMFELQQIGFQNGEPRVPKRVRNINLSEKTQEEIRRIIIEIHAKIDIEVAGGK